jgi:zinc/manganese transport system permease protein
MSGFFHIMALPFLACLILTGIHAYLGLHVIEREVIFVDLALAQIAALGASLALVFDYGLESAQSYWMSLGFTIAGAAIFSLTRFKKKRIPQEAIIGITYAVSAALLVLILSRSGEGDEHIKQALVGNILLIRSAEILKIFGIYSVVGLFHYVFRRKFLLISQNPEEAYRQGINVRLWDFLFYTSFGFVVTSSVRIAGVLLVFSFLVVPSVCAILFSNKTKIRLTLGWSIGFLASVLGMAISYHLDFPTGASVVCTFGLILAVLAFAKKLFVLMRI